jgi:hypothetical protein
VDDIGSFGGPQAGGGDVVLADAGKDEVLAGPGESPPSFDAPTPHE